jgi:hypothetical protein
MLTLFVFQLRVQHVPNVLSEASSPVERYFILCYRQLFVLRFTR